MGNSSSVSDPYVASLTQLLDDIRQGFLLIPRFQRPFLWPLEQQLELLRSIRDGLPIGSILIWRTRTQEIASYTEMGRHLLAQHASGVGMTRQYVLDGFQRLSTLYGALQAEDAPSDDEDSQPVFYLDLETKDFCVEKEAGAAGRFVPMSILLQRIELMRWERKLTDERWVENAEAVFNAFDRCKVPVIPLVTEDMEVATRAFERINTQGMPVSKLHVAHALSWSKNFDLLESTRTLKEEKLAPLGWGEVDDDILLDTCALTLGLPLYGKDLARSVASKLRTEPNALESAIVAVQIAAQFLAAHGMPSPELVPYGRQIVLLAAVFHDPENRRDTLYYPLSAWLWLTTYSELFAGISGGRLQRVHEALKQTTKSGSFVWPGWRPFSRRPLPARFDFRAARGKALAVRLADLKPELSDGSQIEWPGRRSAERLGDSLIQCIPRARLSGTRFACAGNRFLVPPESSAEFRTALIAEQIDSTPEQRRRRRAWLQTHNVSDSALGWLDAGNFEDFVTQREADLNHMEEAFIAQHLTY